MTYYHLADSVYITKLAAKPTIFSDLMQAIKPE